MRYEVLKAVGVHVMTSFVRGILFPYTRLYGVTAQKKICTVVCYFLIVFSLAKQTGYLKCVIHIVHFRVFNTLTNKCT